MPIYRFINDKTQEIKDIQMSMNSIHEYIDDSGFKWRRVFFSPQASIDAKLPLTSEAFLNKNRNKKGSVGNLWDEAREASMKRQDKEGKDPIKQKYWNDWSKTRRGLKHPDAVRDGYL